MNEHTKKMYEGVLHTIESFGKLYGTRLKGIVNDKKIWLSMQYFFQVCQYIFKRLFLGNTKL